MKEYQSLVGRILIAIAIIIAGYLTSQAIIQSSYNISSGVYQMGELIR